METLVAFWAENSSVPFATDGVITFKYYNDLNNGLRDDILWSMDRISDVLPIEFQEVPLNEEADWDLKWLPSDSNWAGYASGNSHSGWDISFNRYDYQDDYDRHLVLHEFGHALGLEHPFDDRDDDVWEGADIQDTVMAYAGSPKGYRIDYSKADWDTLTGLYGGIIPEPLEPVVPETPEVPEVEMGPFGLTEKRWDRVSSRYEKWIERGNTERVIRHLNRQWDAFPEYDLNQKLRKNTFTLQEESIMADHVENEDWSAISQTRFFTRHDPNATICPCCS